MTPRHLISPLWLSPWSSMSDDIAKSLNHISKKLANSSAKLFFKANEMGVPGILSEQIFTLFTKHNAPLCPALVPAWVTVPRWQTQLEQAGGPSKLWCWHQHGWRYKNHESKNQRSEFGSCRSDDELLSDLNRGRQRLMQTLGDQFTPVFTPSWGRMSDPALKLLPQAGFKALSLSHTQTDPESTKGLPEFNTNVDLHTRRSTDVKQDRTQLLTDIENGAASGLCGISIHHQCMNDEALRFLDILLASLSAHPTITLVHFGQLLSSDNQS